MQAADQGHADVIKFLIEHGADVVVPDLRGGYSYVIAALAAEGESTVRNIGIIRRGYEKFLEKLTDLGADFDVTE